MLDHTSKSSVFRKAALDRLSSPERLDELAQVTTSRGWIALLALAGFLCIILVWMIVGKIPVTVGGDGILIKPSGMMRLVAFHEGIIGDILVPPGEPVKAGATIAYVMTDLNPVDSGHVSEATTSESYQKPIISPQSGLVTDLFVSVGDLVTRTTPVVNIEPENESEPLQAIAYVPLTDSKKIKPGMPARIVPVYVKPEEFGYLVGEVTTIADYPASRQSVNRLVANETLTSQLLSKGTLVAVTLNLFPDTETPSGFQWASGQGPEVQLKGGTLSQITIIVDHKRPLHLVFPTLEN